jgi:hypothetical protein
VGPYCSEPGRYQANKRIILLLIVRLRLRAEANPDGLNHSQVAALLRLEENGGMPTADHACAEVMKPQSMGIIIASTRSR